MRGRSFTVEMCMREDRPIHWFKTDLNFGALKFNLRVWAILIVG